MNSEPFPFDDALAKALAADPVPKLSDGFADRVVAATAGRAPPLPVLRRPARRWRSGRRLAIAVLASGALASAAAATGVLEDLGIPVPSASAVWSRITGNEETAAPAAVVPPAAVPAARLVPEAQTPVVIEGPIDTPEELEEAFSRIDAWRGQRQDTRRSLVDQAIDRRLERRRELGLPVPSAEEEERLRARLEELRERQDQKVEGVLQGRREEIREELENGGEFTPRELIERQRGEEAEQLRQRRLERLRQLPPEQRRAVLRRLRDRALQGQSAPQPAPAPEATATASGQAVDPGQE